MIRIYCNGVKKLADHCCLVTDDGSATTLEAPDIVLSANGRKVKGKHTVDLSWTNEPPIEVHVSIGMADLVSCCDRLSTGLERQRRERK